MSFSLFIFSLDIVWLFFWFGVSLWFEIDASIPFDYRDNIRNFLFHYANVGGTVYILKHRNTKELSWFALIPFLFAFCADTQHLVSVVVNLPQLHGAAWGVFLTLSIWALTTTCFGLFNFLRIKK